MVEDERDVREALAEVLESERYEVLRAAHGAEALGMLSSRFLFRSGITS